MNERLLNLLCGVASNPALNRALEESSVDSKFLIRPGRVHYVEQYIMDHDADGSLVVAKGQRDLFLVTSRACAKKAFDNVHNRIGTKKSKVVSIKTGDKRTDSNRSLESRSRRRAAPRMSRSYNKDIIADDFMQRFLAVPQPHREQAWNLLAGVGHSSVTSKGVHMAIESLFVTRRNLASSLQSSKKVISSLNYVLLGMFSVIEVMVAVAIFGSLDNLA